MIYYCYMVLLYKKTNSVDESGHQSLIFLERREYSLIKKTILRMLRLGFLGT